MCQNRPKLTQILAKISDIVVFFCDIVVFFSWILRVILKNWWKKQNINKKTTISRQIKYIFLKTNFQSKNRQKRRKKVSRIGDFFFCQKTRKMDDINRENWVNSWFSKNAYYSRLCSIIGRIWHFSEKSTNLNKVLQKIINITSTKVPECEFRFPLVHHQKCEK